MFAISYFLAFACTADPPIYPVPFPIVRSDAAYNQAFKVSFDGAKIKSNADPNKNAPIENALNNNTAMWECPGWKNGGIYFIITFPKPVEFSRFVFQSRVDVSNRGFPKKYRQFVRYNGDKDFTLIWKSYYSDRTGDPVLIDYNATFSNVIEFKMIYDDIYYTLGNKQVSLTYLGFYIDDEGVELKDTIFTDGLYNKFQPGFDPDKFWQTLKTYPQATQNYFQYNEPLNTAIKEVANSYPEMIEKDIYGFSCFGNLGDEETIMRTDTIHQTYMPIGRYVRSTETLELFCEFGNNTKFPIIKWLKSMDWSGEDQHVGSLRQGYNKIRAPNFSGNTSKIMFAMYHCPYDIGWKGFEYKNPRCRVRGGHTFPQYVLFKSDAQHYFDELAEYQKKVTNMRESMMDESIRSDLSLIITNKFLLIGTSTGAYKGMKNNLPVENAIVKLAKHYDQYPYVYYHYGGFSFNLRGRFFSRVNDNYINDLHAYQHPSFTVFNCQCFNKPDQTSVWSAMVFSTNQMTTTTDNSWGFFHEWGHGMDNNEIYIVEMTNNYYSQALSRFVIRAGSSTYDQGIEDYIKGFYGKYLVNDAEWVGMSQMRQLELYFGPDTHGKANRFVRGNQNYTGIGPGFYKPSDRQHRWIVAVCNVTNMNLNDYFYIAGWFSWRSNGTNGNAEVIKLQKLINEKYTNKPLHNFEYITPAIRAYIGTGTGNDKKGFDSVKGEVMPEVTSVKYKGTGSKIVYLALNNKDANKEFHGYEMRNTNGEVFEFSLRTQVTAPNKKIEIVPIDKRLERGTSIYFEVTGSSPKYLNKSKWKVDNFPGANTYTLVVGKLSDILDNNPKTSYRNGGGIKPNGFIFDLNDHVTFSGFSRVRRDDVYGNTKQYKLYYSNEDIPCTQANFKKINWTQINRNDDTSVLSTSGTPEEFYFFGKEYTAKCIKYESVATVVGDTHCGLGEFSLLNEFSYSVTPGKKYDRPHHPFPDYHDIIDLDKFVPHQPNETDELYGHYPDIYDQPCFAQFGTTKTHRKSKVFDRDAALYAVDPYEKVVDLEIENLSIIKNSKVITNKLIVTQNLYIEKGSRLFADKPSSISFESNCTADLHIDKSMKYPILEIGHMSPNKLPNVVNIHLDLPSDGYFDYKIIKGNEDALRALRDNNLTQLIPNATRTYFMNVNHGYLSVSSDKDESDAGKDGKGKAASINNTTVVVIAVMVAIVVIVILVIIGLILFKRRYTYIDSESFNQLAI